MRLVLVLSVALLLACSDPKIDGSSSAAAAVSVEAIKRDLSPGDRVRFHQALMFIVARELSAASRGSFGHTSTANVDRNVAEFLDGMTVEEVIAHVDADRVEETPARSVSTRRSPRTGPGRYWRSAGELDSG